MAYRELTSQYFKLRSYYVRPQHSSNIFSGDESDDADEMKPITTDEPQISTTDDNNSFSLLGQPEYIKIMSYVRDDIKAIRKKMTILDQMHKEHCTPRFGKDFSDEEQRIEIQTEEIKQMFKKCKEYIERIIVPKEMHTQDDLIKKNTKTSLVIELNDVSKQFRMSQRDYLQKLQALKSRRRDLAPIAESEELDPEEKARIEELEQKMYDPGFTDEQINDLISNQREIMRRDREIREILRSIVELQDLFKEFGELVIQQGTLLDRIDYNLETAHVHIQQANANLHDTEEMMKLSRCTICILLLLVVLVGGVVLVALRFVLRLSIGKVLFR